MSTDDHADVTSHVGGGSFIEFVQPTGWNQKYISGWYAQQRRNFKCERNPDLSPCAMLLNPEISGTPCSSSNLKLWLPIDRGVNYRHRLSHMFMVPLPSL